MSPVLTKYEIFPFNIKTIIRAGNVGSFSKVICFLLQKLRGKTLVMWFNCVATKHLVITNYCFCQAIIRILH